MRRMFVVGATLAMMVSLGLASRADQLSQDAGVPSPAVASLRLTGQIDSEKYCLGDRQLNSLHVSVKLRLQNVGAAPVVFYAGSPSIDGIALARNPEALLGGSVESEMSFSNISESDGPEASLEKWLTVIKPGRIYEFPNALPVAFPITAAGVVMPGIVSPGAHVLRVVLGTWPDGASPASWSTRLAGRGVLLTEPVASQPIPITVKVISAVKCD